MNHETKTGAERMKAAKSHFVLQLIAAAYVAYLIFTLLSGYEQGALGVSFPLYCTIVGVMVAADVLVLIFAVRGWLRQKELAEMEQLEDEYADLPEAGSDSTEN